MANLRILFLFGLIFPMQITSILGRPYSSQVHEDDKINTIPTLESGEFAFTMTPETRSTIIYDGQNQRRSTAHLFRRTNSGGGGINEGEDDPVRRQRVERQRMQVQRDREAWFSRVAERIAAGTATDYEVLRFEERMERVERQRQAAGQPPGSVQRPDGLGERLERIGSAEERQRLREAEQAEFSRRQMEIARQQVDRNYLSIDQDHRYLDCIILVMGEVSAPTSEQHQLCLRFARDLTITVEDLLRDAQLVNEAKNAQQQRPTMEQGDGPNPINSIVTSVSKFADKAGGSIKKAMPSWLNTLDRVVRGQSAPVTKPANGAPALPAMKVP